MQFRRQSLDARSDDEVPELRGGANATTGRQGDHLRSVDGRFVAHADAQSGGSDRNIRDVSPGLLVERIAFDRDGQAIEFSQSWYRGDTYDFVAELSDAT
jgi:hypothetical protein